MPRPNSGNVFFGYSHNSATLNHRSSPGLNGWDGQLEGKIFPFIRLVTDVGGQYGSTSTFPTSHGTQVAVNASEYNFLFGPRASVTLGRFRPFAHALLGASHVSVSGHGYSASDTSLGDALGGGLDYKFWGPVGWRFKGDFLQTRFFSNTQTTAALPPASCCISDLTVGAHLRTAERSLVLGWSPARTEPGDPLPPRPPASIKFRCPTNQKQFKSENLVLISSSDPRAAMVQTQLRDRGIRDERVLAAMLRVPRHEFVAPEFRALAYDDCPLPIAEGQTISQPFIVALMLEALALHPEHTVLEIGSGSGYQTALLSELTTQVFTIERHAALAHVAKEVLTRLGYTNATVFLGDGSQGLAAHAPYHAIAVAAGAPQVPRSLFQQLRVGGRMVIPVGPRHAQDLQVIENANGVPIVSTISGCRFVPLIGAEGFESED